MAQKSQEEMDFLEAQVQEESKREAAQFEKEEENEEKKAQELEHRLNQVQGGTKLRAAHARIKAEKELNHQLKLLEDAKKRQDAALNRTAQVKVMAPERANKIIEAAKTRAEQMIAQVHTSDGDDTLNDPVIKSCRILVSDCNKGGPSGVHFPRIITDMSQPFTKQQQEDCMQRAKQIHRRCGADSGAFHQVIHKLFTRFDTKPSM